MPVCSSRGFKENSWISKLPHPKGTVSRYQLTGSPIETNAFPRNFNRVVFSAAHVVADPFTANDPSGPAAIDWEATMAFRRHLDGLGLGIAEAMDTAQRGMGLDWPGALELIRRTKAELPMRLSSTVLAPISLPWPMRVHLTMCAAPIWNRSRRSRTSAGASFSWRVGRLRK